ncbi:hypothetical protein HNQ94_001518 [Salirhabdus euzebyi]|uniref:Uncharacterized protein n=1 Tax=Salirhabdus euzebyi TaxID=394506 RepID=A0A841Q401_9BACI|nr:hypothetical protein [Salirhabdus euzebyi]MBB6453070.1 hypothetical protein [Salirhabdus euzebyi]
MPRPPENLQTIRFFGALNRFLERNENLFQKREEKMLKVEKDMNEWNNSFLKEIGEVEKMIKEIEKRME